MSPSPFTSILAGIIVTITFIVSYSMGLRKNYETNTVMDAFRYACVTQTLVIIDDKLYRIHCERLE